jgi:signal transduction histidine kinase
MSQTTKHKASILIIDDVPENLDMLARMLIERDYQIRPAIYWGTCTSFVTLKFSITDTGIGIPLEQIDHVFAPFEQIRTQKTAIEGLGLTVSQRLLHKLGSGLHVTSTPGQGRTFWFDITFPMSA